MLKRARFSFVTARAFRRAATALSVFAAALATGAAATDAVAYSGPEIPPSFRTRQKCRIMSTLTIIGMKMQWRT